MKPTDPHMSERRSFLKILGGLTAALTTVPSALAGQGSAPARTAGAKYMGDFVAPKLDTVKIALIGVGARGSGHAAAAGGHRGHPDRRDQRSLRGLGATL